MVDLQLLHVACKAASGAKVERVSGLGTAINRSLKQQLTPEERTRIEEIKELSHRLFAPNLGGSFEVLAIRPMLPVLAEYCTDVRYFHALRTIFAVPRGLLKRGVEVEFEVELRAAVARRVAGAASMGYRPDDRDANTRADPDLVAAVVKRRNEARTAGVAPRTAKVGGGGSGIGSGEHVAGVGGGGGGAKKHSSGMRRAEGGASAGNAAAATTSSDSAIGTTVNTELGTDKVNELRTKRLARAHAIAGESKTEVEKREELKSMLAKHVVVALKPYLKKRVIKNADEFKKFAREITKTVMNGIDEHRGGKYAAGVRAGNGKDGAAADGGGGGGGGGGGAGDTADPSKPKSKSKSKMLPRWSFKSRTPAELEAAALAAVRIRMCDLDPLNGK